MSCSRERAGPARARFGRVRRCSTVCQASGMTCSSGAGCSGCSAASLSFSEATVEPCSGRRSEKSTSLVVDGLRITSVTSTEASILFSRLVCLSKGFFLAFFAFRFLVLAAAATAWSVPPGFPRRSNVLSGTGGGAAGCGAIDRPARRARLQPHLAHQQALPQRGFARARRRVLGRAAGEDDRPGRGDPADSAAADERGIQRAQGPRGRQGGDARALR